MDTYISPKTILPEILTISSDLKDLDTSCDIVLSAPLYEDLQFERVDDSIVYHSSQSFLLNTKRLESVYGLDATRHFVDDALRKLSRDVLSLDLPDDVDFSELIRDKRIQTPRDLKDWIEYTQSLIDRQNDKAKARKSWLDFMLSKQSK